MLGIYLPEVGTRFARMLERSVLPGGEVGTATGMVGRGRDAAVGYGTARLIKRRSLFFILHFYSLSVCMCHYARNVALRQIRVSGVFVFRRSSLLWMTCLSLPPFL